MAWRFPAGRRRGQNNFADPDSQEQFQDLLVFGYSCTIYRDDQRAEWIDRGEHLIPWMGDTGLMTDRHDCRLHLHDRSLFDEEYNETEPNNDNNEDLPMEEFIEEQMCEAERYADLVQDSDHLDDQEEELKRGRGKGAEIGFSYDKEQSGLDVEATQSAEEEEEEEDLPYEADPDLKAPLGINLPESMKESAIIERTAVFVAQQGTQMEIVIKAKQKSNRQFGFLDWDHRLNPFYKHVLKMIKERKYKPKVREPKKKKQKKKERGLVSYEEDSGSESDEEGGYLHPSLFAPSKDKPTSKNGSGTNSPNGSSTPNVAQPTYKLGEENDVYSALYKKLSALMPRKEAFESTETVTQQPENISQLAPIQDPTGLFASQQSYYEWHHWFYGYPPLMEHCPPPNAILPPPPDLQPVVDKTAEFVAKFGPQAEEHLRRRMELQLDFLRREHPYFAYYQMKVRWIQCNDTQAGLTPVNYCCAVQNTVQDAGNASSHGYGSPNSIRRTDSPLMSSNGGLLPTPSSPSISVGPQQQLHGPMPKPATVPSMHLAPPASLVPYDHEPPPIKKELSPPVRRKSIKTAPKSANAPPVGIAILKPASPNGHPAENSVGISSVCSTGDLPGSATSTAALTGSGETENRTGQPRKKRYFHDGPLPTEDDKKGLVGPISFAIKKEKKEDLARVLTSSSVLRNEDDESSSGEGEERGETAKVQESKSSEDLRTIPSAPVNLNSDAARREPLTVGELDSALEQMEQFQRERKVLFTVGKEFGESDAEDNNKSSCSTNQSETVSPEQLSSVQEERKKKVQMFLNRMKVKRTERAEPGLEDNGGEKGENNLTENMGSVKEEPEHSLNTEDRRKNGKNDESSSGGARSSEPETEERKENSRKRKDRRKGKSEDSDSDSSEDDRKKRRRREIPSSYKLTERSSRRNKHRRSRDSRRRRSPERASSHRSRDKR